MHPTLMTKFFAQLFGLKAIDNCPLTLYPSFQVRDLLFYLLV